MGTYEQGILGAFSGLVGPVVGSSFRGKSVMRGRPRKSKKAPTNGQLAQRSRFTEVTRFLTPAKGILSEYFGMPSRTRSRYNMATSYHLQEAVVFGGGGASILYNKALFSKGNLLGIQNLVVSMEPGSFMKLNWTSNSNQGTALGTDTLMVLIYEPAAGVYEFYQDAAIREEFMTVIQLPGYLSGAKVQGWAFMVSANGLLKSTSQYLGELIVT